MNSTTELFEQHRPQLFRIAYGMLERVAPAKDIVQEAYLRWQDQDIDNIKSPHAYLSKIVSRLCLDELKSAKSRREQYIGPDLPEPVLTSESGNPTEHVELTETLSMALLVVLEQLTPVQRAVFLLREVFDYDYASIASVVDKSEAHCRKIAQRARDQVHEQRPYFEKDIPKQNELITSFFEAVQTGDISEVKDLLKKEATLYSDGGGKVTAARKPIYGDDKIARFMLGIQKKAPEDLHIEFQDVNGEPGAVVYIGDELYNVWSFHTEGEVISNIFVVLNPEKLEHIEHESL
ncbi:RNA polymerase sigma-70 factor [Fodinibius halophilus]|uniref:RNA polymerase sigma-70 factor n=1 Tax=Fodinibius halophilus TaxID=1736908 RepID=A0A6M1SZJ6_9BACT|nr:RNA polymerase sigma-70 factor [Fodinibius halophilus]NGP87077.1 RNA polymerase sigma-70 factor [Fodinibius halophilus]